MINYRKIRHIAWVAVLLTTTSLSAQTIEDFRQKLSLFDRSDDYEYVKYANVVLREDSSTRAAFAALADQQRRYDEEGVEMEAEPATINGYRIGIFFDNSYSARAKANNIMQLCDSLLADVPATMSYDNPYFKVSAGYCLSGEEAAILLHRVQKIFPQAYLMREQITPSNIVESYQDEVELKRAKEQDSLLLEAMEMDESNE